MLGLIATTSNPASAQGSAPNLANAVVFSSEIKGLGIAKGDLDNDGDLDLVVCGGGCALPPEDPNEPPAPISILLNTGSWSPATNGFGSPIVPDRGCTEVGLEVIIAPLDDDLYADIAVTVVAPSTRWVVVYLNADPNNPGTTYTRNNIEITSTLTDIHGLAYSDIDGDGDNDLIVAGQNTSVNKGKILILYNDGDAGFATTDTIELDDVTGSAWDVAASQFDLDGSTRDLATCNLYHNSVTQIQHRGDGTFREETIAGPVDGPKFYYSSIAAGRLDSDVAREIGCSYDDPNHGEVYGDVFRHDPNTLIFIHERPTGADSGDNYGISTNRQAMSGSDIGRINAGADRDVVFTLDYTQASGLSDVIVVVLGNGDGTLSRSTYYSYAVQPPGSSVPASGPSDVVLADLNDDGLLDVITSNWTDSISVFLNSYTSIEE